MIFAPIPIVSGRSALCCFKMMFGDLEVSIACENNYGARASCSRISVSVFHDEQNITGQFASGQDEITDIDAPGLLRLMGAVYHASITGGE